MVGHRGKRFPLNLGMIATKNLPAAYQEWNATHGAPHGHRVRFGRMRQRLPKSWLYRAAGPFFVQTNNTTRTFEYPWAFESAQLSLGQKVLEVGGSLAGFQFVLARHGCRVVNVDPGMEAAGVGWPCDQNSIARLNRIFHTQVELRNTTIERADLSNNEFDRAFAISVVEHLPPADATNVMAHTFRALKPGGLFVITLDLFLNLHPFTERRRNEYGVNQSVSELIAAQPWRLVAGQREELFGFPEFDREKIQSRLETFFVGSYPALAQCLVLQKPDRA
jgi:SAM-dependent methyltransferase